MELEDLLANSQRQVRLLEQNDQRRKQQLENLILINNRITLDNAALKKEIEKFREQREDILADMDELKHFHRELCGKHEALQHENQILHENMAAERIQLERTLTQLELSRREQEEQYRRIHQLKQHLRSTKQQGQQQQLSLLEQSINERASFFQQKTEDYAISQNQQQLRQRIQSLEAAIEKYKQPSTSPSKPKRCTCSKRFSRLSSYILQLKQNIQRSLNKQKASDRSEKLIGEMLLDTVEFLQKQVLRER